MPAASANLPDGDNVAESTPADAIVFRPVTPKSTSQNTASGTTPSPNALSSTTPGATPNITPGTAPEATSDAAPDVSPSAAPDAASSATPNATPSATPNATPNITSNAVSGTASGTSPTVAAIVSHSTATAPAEPLIRPHPGTIETITTEQQAEALAEYLTDPDREHPALVVSRRFGRALFDLNWLMTQLSDVATVVDLSTSQATMHLSQSMPRGTHVFGGSARLYPPGIDWVDHPNQMPPYYIGWSDAEISSLSGTIVDTAQGMVARGWSSASAPALTNRQTVHGEIRKVYPGRGIAQLDDGMLASVVLPERYDADYSRLLHIGQRFTGSMDPQQRVVMVDVTERDPIEAIGAYREGATVLARVSTVRADYCIVELFPGFRLRATAEDAFDTDDDLRLMLSEGMVIPMLIIVRGDAVAGMIQQDWLLSFTDADVTALVDAPSLLDGGPAWLNPDDLRTVDAPTVEGSTAMISQFDSVDDLREFLAPGHADTIPFPAATEMYQHLDRLRTLNEQLCTERDRLRGELERMKTHMLNRQRERSHDSQQYRRYRDLFPDADDGAAFERDQMDAAIRRAWALRFPAGDKCNHPLPKRWEYADQFFDTLERTHIGLGKVVDVIVEVLVGIDTRQPGRQHHRLRSGTGGDDPYRLGPSGETCFRVALQVNFPQARRLHYMKAANGLITFASVRNHDDFSL